MTDDDILAVAHPLRSLPDAQVPTIRGRADIVALARGVLAKAEETPRFVQLRDGSKVDLHAPWRMPA